MMLTPEQGTHFAELALGGITREYPNKLDHVINGPADLLSPRALHPAFYGCFDWHSSVHGHWMLVRLLRLCPACPTPYQYGAALAANLTRENLQAERAYLDGPTAIPSSAPTAGPGCSSWPKSSTCGTMRRPSSGRRHTAPGRRLCRALPRVPAQADLPDPRGHPFQHRVRPDIRAGLCPHTSTTLPWKACSPSGAWHYFGNDRDYPAQLGAERQRLPLARSDRGLPDEERHAAGRVRNMVQQLPARHGAWASRPICLLPRTCQTAPTRNSSISTAST